MGYIISKYLDKLNAEQLEAATSINGRVLILAGAGTGKTATLIARTAYMLDNDIKPENILLLTFTNKAAKEMKMRLSKMFDYNTMQITASTFHSFCADILRHYSSDVGVDSNFEIIDQNDALTIMDIERETFLLKHSEIDFKEFLSSKQIYHIFENSINKCVPLSKIIDDCSDNQVTKHKSDILAIIQNFRNHKKENHQLDYNDLLQLVYQSLKNNEELKMKLNKKFKYVSCDEYQDTNIIQNKILDLLTCYNKNLCVVGDDNQSIYAFRNAEIENILNFNKVYLDCKVITLKENYRSSQEILDVANSVMDKSNEGIKKPLKGQFHSSKPKLIYTRDEFEQVNKIIDKIQTEECQYKDIAILTRNAHSSYMLENALNLNKIPYKKFGGLNFFDKIIIRNILSLLKLLINFKNDIALFRILQLFPKIGQVTAKTIIREIVKVSETKYVSFKLASSKYRVHIDKLFNFIEKEQDKNIEEQISDCINFYQDLMLLNIENKKVSKIKKDCEIKKLVKEIDEANMIIQMASSYKTLKEFLSDITLDRVYDDDEKNYVTISTIHSAKGLEFKNVIIINAVDMGYTFRPIKEFNEELRCMYVALTRAKENLSIFVPKNINERKKELIPFLDDEDVLENFCIVK